MKIEIIFQDDDLIIINKPAGTLVIPERFQPDDTSLNKVLEALLQHRVWVVHRLDRDTSGVVCFAKNEKTHKYLSALFQEREVSKTYLALAVGRPSIEEGSINKPIMEHPVVKGKMVTNAKGKPSLTDYKVVQQWALYSLIELQLHTGRTHQIRVHLQALGNPVVCDDVYGDGKPFLLSNIKKKFKLSKQEEEERPLLSRLALHAYQLQFKKEDGTPINAVAPLPKDMAACINQLNKWSK